MTIDFSKITKAEWALFIGLLAIVIFLWLMQRSKHPFDLRDTLLDPVSGRTSQIAIIKWIGFIASVYFTFVLVQKGKDITEFWLGVLAIFILNQLGYQYINKNTTWKNEWITRSDSSPEMHQPSGEQKPLPTKDQLIQEYKDGFKQGNRDRR